MGEADAHDVQAAHGGRAGQHHAAAHAHEDAAQQAGSQGVLHDGGGGDGHDGVEEGARHRADQGPQGHAPAQQPPGVDEDGDVDEEVEDTGHVDGPQLKVQPAEEQRPQDLAEAHQAAGIEAQGHDEEVHAHGAEQRAENGRQQPQARMVQETVEHGSSSSFVFRGSLPGAVWCYHYKLRREKIQEKPALPMGPRQSP